MNRCTWAKDGDELYIHYHDTEWGEKRIRGALQEVVDSFVTLYKTVTQLEQRL